MNSPRRKLHAVDWVLLFGLVGLPAIVTLWGMVLLTVKVCQ